MKPFILHVLISLGLIGPIVSSAATHQVEINQDRWEPAAFGTSVFGFGQKNENTGIWPCNFWSNFNEKDLAYDLEMLKLEGGNAGILLFPFFDIDDATAPTKNRLAQLKKILELCAARGSSLTLRLGYAWDNGFPNATKKRQVDLLVDPEQRKKWYRFCDETYALASKHASFRGAFICWEDFWGLLAGASFKEKERKAWANYIHYPHESVPARDTPAMEEFFDYFDTLLAHDFFAGTQGHFPNLGMEVRMDEDPIFQNGAYLKSFVHKKLFSAPNLTNVYIYWAAFMGAPNEGDLISADHAVRLLLHALEKAQHLSAPDARLIISQFNFRDNTPGTSRNSQIAPDQLHDFLQRSSKILSQYCTGIFTWSNTSYFHNAINNGTFSTGSNFWRFEKAVVGLEDDQPSVSVFPGGTISQLIEPNTAVSAGLIESERAQIAFSAKASANTTCLVSLGTKSQTLVLKGKDQWYRYEVALEKPSVAGETLSLSFPKGALVDDIVVTNHKQEMGAQNPEFARDAAYADFAWQLSLGRVVPTTPTVVSGVTEDNWIMSRATLTAPTHAGKYRLTVNLTVPESIRGQSVLISLHAQSNPATKVELSPGPHRLEITGNSSQAAILLTLAFTHHQKLSPDGPDVRELAAHLDAVGE